jgi:outer membrane protein insertion porin family
MTARMQKHKDARTLMFLGYGCGLAVLFAFMFILAVCTPYCRAQDKDWVELEKLSIGNIEIRGNITIKRDTILATIRTREGDLFSRAAADEDIKLIGDKIAGVTWAGWDAEAVDNQVKLIITIREENLVRVLAFIGNHSISSAKLAKELTFTQRDYLHIPVVISGVDALTELYHKKGHAFVEISVDETRFARGEVVYNIKEGPRVKISRVEFTGNESIKSKELKKAIKTRTRKFLFWPVYYDEQVISKDVTKLQDIYQKKGFLDARVDAVLSLSEDKRLAYVTFTMEEGPVYTIQQIIIRGNEFFDAETLTRDMKLKVGQFYSKERGDYDARHIRSRYLERGFVEANVEHRHSLTPESRVIAVFEITEGEQFRIGRVAITGNEATQDRVIRRILDEENFKPGQWFNADVARGDGTGELEKTVQRLVMAKSVSVKPVGTKAGQRDARINIEEGQTGQVMFSVGAASDSGLIGGVTYDERNFDITNWPTSIQDFIERQAFKGGGRHMRISVMPGTLQSTFSVSYTEPYLYDKPISLNLEVSGFERGRESYDEDRLKGYFGFEKRYQDKWRRGISFRTETVDVTDLDSDAPKEIRAVKGGNDLFGAKLYIRKDTTDSRFTPSSGYHFNAGYEQVGGDHTFGILSGTQRWYKTLYQDLTDRKTVFELKLHGATVVGDAPPFEKFYAGGTGAGSLRGFDYRGVSTRGLQYNPTNPIANPKRKDPIGSDWILLANAEVAVPLTTEVLSALFFVDAGTIDSGGVRASVGVGLQILIPQWFGPVPMRFELATPFMKDGDDETRIFSFSVGALF